MSLPTPTLSPSETNYIITSLSHPSNPTRLDARSLIDSRPIEISYGVFPHANGSARVKVGGTEIIAGIKLEVVDSESTSNEKEKKGLESWRCKVEVDVTPQSYPTTQPNTLSSISTYLSSLVSSHFTPSLTPFTIIPNTKFFQPQIHLTVLSSDGNIPSGLIIACRAAFSDLKIPRTKIISWTGENDDHNDTSQQGGQGDLSGIKAAISRGTNKNGKGKGRYIARGGEDWDLDLNRENGSASLDGTEYMSGRENLPVLITLNLVPNSENVFIDATLSEESACPSKLHLFFSNSSSISSSSTQEERELKVCGVRLEGNGQSIDSTRIKTLLEQGSEFAKGLIDQLNSNLPSWY
ncbi:uncharacterized protein IL334_006222 [Kwoniella shivajii]|uniref:Ribosomal RNA-processing protein 42 n=1 Tax=Kwoniella shivajii TaxID=564305 RepID=A0ABZ1D5Z5_9TREE|nr:hypothetical protein IL334_006222 [Kwoniella shivajii]